MKKLIIMMALGAVSSLAYAQNSSIPAEVKAAFEKKYPSAKEVKWDKEEENFEASFDLDNKDQSVLLDKQGNILETEVEMNPKDLPSKINEYVSKNYPGKKITEAAMIMDAKGAMTYEAEVKGMDLMFTSAGSFIDGSKE